MCVKSKIVKNSQNKLLKFSPTNRNSKNSCTEVIFLTKKIYMHNIMELVHYSNSTMWASHKTCCLFCTCPRWTSEVYFAEEGKSGRFCLLSFHHLGSVKFAAASFEIPSFSAAKLPWSLINWTMFHSTRTLPKDEKNPMKVKVIEPFKTFCCALQISWTFSALCWQSTVSRSFDQFLVCPDSF